MSLPTVSRPLLRWFTWYSRRYLRRHFHTVRVSYSGPPPVGCKLPLVIYANHASWWDPLVGLVLNAEFSSGRTAYAPIDAAALARYRLFARLGFFGVERGSRRGATHFVRTAQAILRHPTNTLWITPQGRFSDVRERPLRFEAGLGFLASHVDRAAFVPFATEFVFWEERLPEILVRFGEPHEVRNEGKAGASSADWTAVFEQALSACMDTLAHEAQRRDPKDFKLILRGRTGTNRIYDTWRRLRARWRGEDFKPEHGIR